MSQESRKRFKNNKLRPAQPIIMVAEKHSSEHEIRQFPYISEPTKRTTSDQSYESVKPKSFMTIPTSRTSCQRSQVKSRNHGKTHIFQH